MTAPKQMWRETISPNKMYPNGGSFYYEAGKPKTVSVARYISADAPELLALVDAVKELIQIRAVWTDPHNDEICGKALAAISAYEALQ